MEIKKKHGLLIFCCKNCKKTLEDWLRSEKKDPWNSLTNKSGLSQMTILQTAIFAWYILVSDEKEKNAPVVYDPDIFSSRAPISHCSQCSTPLSPASNTSDKFSNKEEMEPKSNVFVWPQIKKINLWIY